MNDPLGPDIPKQNQKQNTKPDPNCKGCQRAGGGTNQAQLEDKIFYGKPLYPGLKAKVLCQDELFDAAKNQWVIYRPTMVNLCTPNLPHDSDQSATAPLPTPQQAHLAPGWTPESFAQANKGIRSTLAGVSLDAQPDENLKYFWAAVAKYAPQSAEYYVAQGVPVPADFKPADGSIGGGGGLQIGGMKLTPVQILLIAALAWYLLKK